MLKETSGQRAVELRGSAKAGLHAAHETEQLNPFMNCGSGSSASVAAGEIAVILHNCFLLLSFVESQ